MCRLLLPILILCALPIWGQTPKLTGKLLDVDGKPMASAAIIRLSPKDSSMQEGALSDEDGVFKIGQGDSGQSILRAQAIGYETKTWLVKGDDVGSVQLSPSGAKKLKEVEVVAQRRYIEVLPDKLVVNVAGSINAQGNTGLELLRKSPGVVVDKDDNVSLKGKGVRILIDGKPTQLSGPDLANFLKNLQSSDIESIELISNPSAKYEAQGSGGIINIKLKKNKNFGTNGSINLTYGHGIFNKHNQSLNLNNRTKKFNFFGNVGTYQGAWRNYFNNNRRQSDTLYAERNANTGNYDGNNFKVGTDWFINGRHTVGILASGGHNSTKMIQNSYTAIGRDTIGALPQRSLLANSTNDNIRERLNTNLNYKYTDTSGRELTVDIDYGVFTSNERRFVPNMYSIPTQTEITTLYAFRIYSPIRIGFVTGKADWEQKLWGGNLTGGVRLSRVKTKNNFNFYDTLGRENNLPFNDERSNQFNYDEQVHAVYTEYRGTVGSKVKYQVGLRMESTRTKGTLNYRTGRSDSTFTRSYDNFFPTGGITYELGKKHALGVNYSRRIDRPDYESLNPFEEKQNDFSSRSGNPYLLPQFTQNVELNYTFNNSVNFSVAYSKTTDAYAEIVAKADARRTFIQSQNLARIDAINVSLSTPLPIMPWWQGYLNLVANYSIYNPTFGSDTALARFGAGTLRNYTGNAFMQHTFTLGRGWKAELSGWGSLPAVWGGTFETSAQGSVDVGLQRSMLKDRCNIRISYSDIFYSTPWKGNSNYGGINTQAYGNWESQQIRISLDYRFGSDQIKGARNRRSGAEDLNSRVKSGN